MILIRWFAPRSVDFEEVPSNHHFERYGIGGLGDPFSSRLEGRQIKKLAHLASEEAEAGIATDLDELQILYPGEMRYLAQWNVDNASIFDRIRWPLWLDSSLRSSPLQLCVWAMTQKGLETT